MHFIYRIHVVLQQVYLKILIRRAGKKKSLSNLSAKRAKIQKERGRGEKKITIRPVQEAEHLDNRIFPKERTKQIRRKDDQNNSGKKIKKKNI